MKTHYYSFRKNRRSPAGRVLAGIVLLIVGGVLFANRLGVELPSYLFTWKMALIAFGVYLGAKRLFFGAKWLIPIFIGALFMAEDIWPNVSLHSFFWPIFFVFVGLIMIFKPKRRWSGHCRNVNDGGPGRDRFFWDREMGAGINGETTASSMNSTTSNEDTIQASILFGGEKKNVFNKNFKGGVISCVFGGLELDLMHADFEGTIELEFNQVFGGVKLIMPSHWLVDNRIESVLGGIEDKRRGDYLPSEPAKTVILKGSNVFGGIEIKSR